MDTTRKTLYLIDGSALMYRAYFAFIRKPLVNSRGEDTSAAFGFTNAILTMVRDHHPDYLAIVFDTGRPTFRHEMYAAYKATRQKMPSEMITQIPRIHQAVEALGLRRIEAEGFEADDVIGTLAVRAADEGFEVYMVTGDKDFMQLLGPHISMFVPMKNEIIRPETVKERYGVPPGRVIDLLALMGDSSDNVPGVPKVGEKTARELLERFATFDAVLERSSEITKPSVRAGVEENRELALLSRKLVTIRTDVPIDIKLEFLRFAGFTTDPALDFFREMEFSSLVDMVKMHGRTAAPEETVAVVNAEGLDRFFRDLAERGDIALDLAATSDIPMTARITGIALAAGDTVGYLPLGHSGNGNLDPGTVCARLRELLTRPNARITAHDAKFHRIVFERYGLGDIPFAFDTLLAAYVLEPGIRSYDVEALADIHLKRRMRSLTELTGTGRGKTSFADLDPGSAAGYAGSRAVTVSLLQHRFAERMEREGLAPLYTELELPLMEVLAEMEMRGVRLDTHLLAEMSSGLARSMEEFEERIAESAGERFNINSPRQLAHILFEKLGLKPLRKGKTGYSTDIDVLTKLAALHELPNLILEYRQLAKLKSTYVDALPQMINPETGRVHTSFNQAVTSTGRLSSSNPNLQNIPIRTELGRNIRRAFIADPGHVILSADYSQIELRVMAHISQDPALLEAFRNGADIHATTASLIFGLLPGMLTSEHRRLAKVINFGVMYGMGPHSLSEQLGITFGEAKRYIEHYFETHPGVRTYIDRTVREAEEKDYVTTLLGRKRYVTDIHSPNRNVAEFAKRTAINTPIQGSAADLIKKSMIELSRRLKREGLKAAMVLQVHDELVLEVPQEEIKTVRAVVKEVMEGAMHLTVPLVVETGYGTHWLEAH